MLYGGEKDEGELSESAPPTSARVKYCMVSNVVKYCMLSNIVAVEYV